jgi:signal transduction histidine kinase
VTPLADPRAVRERLRLPRHSLRLRLTFLYGSLFLASGAALLTITYFLVRHQYTDHFFIATGKSAGAQFSVTVAGNGRHSPSVVSHAGGVGIAGGPVPQSPRQAQALALQAQRKAHQQSVAALRQLLIDCGVALATMAVLAIGLGWFVAGRALRPLRTMSNAARDISASSLHRRLSLPGPDDELKQLGNTIDGLLARLEASFDAQRQFVANASHELRTPLTLERTLVEVALADPEADNQTLRGTLERVLAAGEQQERLIEALLTLSRSQRGLDHHESFDLAAVTEEVLLARRGDAQRRLLRIDATLEPAPAWGDAPLAERLIANLVDNAMRHNVAGGGIEIATGTRAGRTILSVANSGPVVPAADLERLFEPFQRRASERHGDDGLGLGLSIVHAIAEAHGADLAVRPQPGGGLDVEVSFRAPHAEAEPARWRPPSVATSPVQRTT